MTLHMRYLALALLASSLPAMAQQPPLPVIPASPVALEVVHIDVPTSNCDQIRGVDLIEGGLRVQKRTDDRNPFVCDSFGTDRIALGAFAPGTYRVELRQTYATGAAAVLRELTQFVVLPGTSSQILNDFQPRVDYSGVWTSPTEPSTGLFLVHSFGALASEPLGLRPVELLTGFWAVFDSSGAPTWYLLAMEKSFATVGRFVGTAVRYTASGSGTSRVVVPSTAGTVTFDPTQTTGNTVRVNVSGQEFVFDIERFRWTRAAWPGPAPFDF